VPEKHISVIKEIARKFNGQPRYAIASELVRLLQKKENVDEHISLKTALDYVNSSVNEGYLKKVGFNLFPVD
jgi:hypothetical protein